MQWRVGRSGSQRGAALLALLALVVVAFSWFLIAALRGTGNHTAQARAHNAAVMQRAKQALVGYIIRQAALQEESNPGRLPCPEARGYIGTASEGIAAGSCAAPALGRLPWRTLGLDRTLDAFGEPLWYAVSPGWALPRPGAELSINSDTEGGLALDGRANAAVALIIAPGPALAAPAFPGCAARIQRRGITPPDVRDYLECENAAVPADARFVSAGPLGAFNDQVLQVTVADLLPMLEAAIKVRIERDVVPALREVYAGPQWGLPAGHRMFPYAAPFTNPGQSNFRGAVGATQGLLPFSAALGCDARRDARCIPSLTGWDTRRAPNVIQTGGSGRLRSAQCGFGADASAWCRGTYIGAPRLSLNATQRGVGLALRKFDPQKATVYYYSAAGQVPVAGILSGRLAADASASVELSGTLPDQGRETDFYMIMASDALADHPLLDRSNPTSGWFVRNEWFRLVYYAFAPKLAPGGLGQCSATDPVTCLQVENFAPRAVQPAILVLAGRSLGGTARPNESLADYLEGEENRDGDGQFVQHVAGTSFNDRFIGLDADP
jgi:hypothetical protein